MLLGEMGTREQLGSRGKGTAWGNGESSELSRGLTKQSLECQAVNPKELEEASRALSSPSLCGGPALCPPTPQPTRVTAFPSSPGRGSWRPSLCATKCHPQWAGHPIQVSSPVGRGSQTRDKTAGRQRGSQAGH